MGFNVHDDSSFGNDQFTAVIATDKESGRKMLLCSIHAIGYGIGDLDSHVKAAEQIRVIRDVVEKIAHEHDVEGIMMGGDFNSVEESVENAASPLTKLTEAKYVPIKVNGDTEIAPSDMFQTGYKLARKIDHFFMKWVGEEGKDFIAAEADIESLTSPLKQYKKVFDHAAIVAKIEVPQKSVSKSQDI
ncbi:MAG: hypothetical protein H0T62_00525 [Parachlamydiaceae bacterium]|nr:hypothetical protein [Parachlamydiaceae bacterium]